MPITITGALQQKKIHTGKQVTVSGDSPNFEYAARITEIDGQSLHLRVLAPYTHHLKELDGKATLTVSFVVPEDAIYSFLADIKSCDQKAKLLFVEQAAPFIRTEQRSDVRMKTSKIIFIQPGGDRQPYGPIWEKASLLDLSRGGASILTKEHLPAGSKLSVWIPLDEIDYVLEAAAQVMRVKTAEEEHYVLGVRFLDLSLPEQEKILDYIIKVWTELKDAPEQPTQ